MRRLFTPLLTLTLLLVLHAALIGQCPEDPYDRGECDTLHVICADCNREEGTGPWTVRFPLLVTHDQTVPDDSIAGFSVPLVYTHTNPAAYCSASYYWNAASMMYYNPDFNRSIFQHIVEGTDTLFHNRMAVLEGDFSDRGWDFTELNLDGTGNFWLLMIPTGSKNQKWWEGDNVLLATMSLRIQDTMQVCVDTTFWWPATSLSFVRSDGETYTPRHNFPHCFWIGPTLMPDFAIESEPNTYEIQVGDSAIFALKLTSLFGFDSPCSLWISGIPPDASFQLDDIFLVPTDSTVLRINTEYGTPPGEYEVTVTAQETGGTFIQHSIDLTLVLLRSDTLWITAYSPVDLIVTDPVGDSIGLEFNTIQDAIYDTLLDVNEDGDKDDQVTIPHCLIGNYLVRVISEPGAAPGDSYTLSIRIDGGSASPPVHAPAPPPGQSDDYIYMSLPYLRGDANSDNITNLGDAIFELNYLFKSGPAPDPLELGDVNCNGIVDLGDAIYLLNYLFKGGDPPCS